ncbi:MAG: hypothetical protein HQL52_04475 [Magnetococcales bacterium]|nr:hypothetical protein [Magnetococcales bacterium]
MARILDFKMLTGGIVVLILSLAASGGFVWYAQSFEKDQKKMARVAKKRSGDIKNRLARAKEDTKSLHLYQPRYTAYEKQGLLGADKRSELVKILRNEAERLGVEHITYSISDTSPYQPTFDAELDTVELTSNTMELSMDLLHEADLFGLLGILEKRAKGLFTGELCSLTRLRSQIQPDSTESNISGQCRLRWFFIKLSKEGQIS